MKKYNFLLLIFGIIFYQSFLVSAEKEDEAPASEKKEVTKTPSNTPRRADIPAELAELNASEQEEERKRLHGYMVAMSKIIYRTKQRLLTVVTEVEENEEKKD